MSFRYLIRRPNPADFKQIRELISDLDQRLGSPDLTAAAKLKTNIWHNFSPTQQVMFTFSAHKHEQGSKWTCPSMEIVAETEADFRQMAERFKIGNLSHIDRP